LDNRYDRILKLVSNRVDRVSGKIAKDFKGTTPFDKVKISDSEMLNEYLSIQPEQMQGYAQQYGEEAVEKYVNEMEALKRRKYG